ncbi:MAG TPA: divalent-cation tolerance protein CutA [Planctomycetota bacterium]|nr:divalent-cation tolerance protein CutA [Planctomycetota bacterium]
MTDLRVVFVTVSSEEEGMKIARALVAKKLAACVNLVPGVRSVFRWKGEVKDEKELLLVVKTRESKLAHLVQAVKELHSYTVPETIALPILGGSEAYLGWLREETP